MPTNERNNFLQPENIQIRASAAQKIKTMRKLKNWGTMTDEDKHSWEERTRVYYREYHKRNKDKRNEQRKIYGIINKERIAECRKANAPITTIKTKAWRLANPENTRKHSKNAREKLTDAVVASELGIPVSVARGIEGLIEAKRELIKISKLLKPITKGVKAMTNEELLAHSSYLMKRPCTRCGIIDKYNDGRCKPCTKESNRFSAASRKNKLETNK